MRGKSAIALLACTCMPCLAQTSNPVTLYGRIYVTAESVRATGGANPVARTNRIEDQSSLLGVRGSEDLGGGLSAFFQLETGFPADQSTGTFANRNSGVGLQGTWGSVFMGRWDTPFKMSQVGSVDPWSDLQIGDMTGAAVRQGRFSLRANNVIQYWSPSYADISARFVYSANEGKTATANPYLYGLSIAWSKGSSSLSYAYEKHNDSIGATATAGVDEEGHAISGEHLFGPVKLTGQYGEYTRTGTTKQKGYQAGAQWLVGKHTLIGTYSGSEGGGASSAAPQPECTLAAAGYKYAFSRRTFFIASYAKVENKSGSLCNFGSNPLTITEGQDPEGLSLGIRTVF